MKIVLEDMLTVVKPPAESLDLFRTKVKSKEDFERAYEKIHEYKVRPEKISRQEALGEGPRGWKATPGKHEEPQAGYTDPLPPSMQGLNMEEFYEVDIDWRMLTTARPKTRHEEEIFSRFVEMGRRQLQRIRQDNELLAQGKDWRGRIVKVVPGRGSVPETRLPICKECNEELCHGGCKEYLYVKFMRLPKEEKKEEDESDVDVEELDNPKPKGKKKKKGKKKGKKKKQQSQGGEFPDEDADDEDDGEE
ncbi:uncharacterized protein LOC135223535 [Macrobrachium nipponense]|uniref:uncharacterized protein LOC135223535 n=1 Tax=Macrobrachium nipponense TaxID=159736 RepID=UPI0030C88D05